MTATPTITSNLLRQLIPLNALLEDELLYLAQHSQVIHLPAQKRIALNSIKDKLYLLSGDVLLLNNNVVMRRVRANTNLACSALNRSRSFALTLKTQTAVTLLRVNLAQLEQRSAANATPAIPSPQAKPVKQTPPNIQPYTDKQLLAFKFFHSVFQQQCLTVIRESTQITGDNKTLLQRQNTLPTDVYLLLVGTAVEYTQTNQSKKIYRRLKAGDLFGHMSLLSQRPHGSGVVLTSPCLLLKMPANVFLNYQKHWQQSLPQRQARDFISQEKLLCIDVRDQAAYLENHIEPSLHIEFNYFHYPFNQLVKKWPMLKQQNAFLVYSDGNKCAEAIAFQLQTQNLRGYILEDGFDNFPYEHTSAYKALREEQKQHEISDESAQVFDEVEKLLEDESNDTDSRDSSLVHSAVVLKNRAAIISAQIIGSRRLGNSAKQFIQQKKTTIGWVIALGLVLLGVVSLFFSPLGAALLHQLFP